VNRVTQRRFNYTIHARVVGNWAEAEQAKDDAAAPGIAPTAA